MALEKKRKKTGGRKKGTPNKVTTEARQFMFELSADNQALFRTYFDELKETISTIKAPAVKANAMMNMLKVYLEVNKFIIPSLQSVDITESKEVLTTLQQKLKEAASKSTK